MKSEITLIQDLELNVTLSSVNVTLLRLCCNTAPEVVEKPGDTSLSQLKNLFIQAKELSESEVT